MRISSNTVFDSNVASMTQAQSRLIQTQQQITSGRKILTAADDPVAAARALDLSQSDAINTQYATNRDSARHNLSLTETTLQNVTLLLEDVKTSLVNAGNGAFTVSDRKSIATELKGRLQELVSLANSTDGIGNYLFAGFQSRTQPFTDTPGGMGYFGDDGQRLIQVNSSRQMPSGNTGADVFMRIKDGNGTFTTSAAATNAGTGVISPGSITNSASLTGHNYTIAFAPPVSAASGNAGNGTATTPVGTASTTDDYSIVFTSPTAYDVFRTTTATPPVGPMPVSAGNAYVSGQNIALPNGLNFSIQSGTAPFAAGDRFDVASSPGYIVTDTTNLPNTVVLPAAPALSGRVPYVSGQAISFDGIQFDVQGVPVYGDKFTVRPSANESMFKTISDAIATLDVATDGSGALANGLVKGLNNIENALNNVLTVRSSLGVRLNELDALQAEGDNLGLQYKQSLASLQDVDYNKAISDLVMQQTALQAAQQTFSKVSGLSLFNYL